jgi:hypothetical protein
VSVESSPKLFISYSWTTPEHEQWVLRLSTELRESGVDVILDKWDLKEGQDAIDFMEQMVKDPDIKKVAIICDRVYSEKADVRKGGVGTETQIITPEIYDKTDQNKFVVVSTEKDAAGEAYRPVYYKSRIYIDLSDDDLYAKNFEQLLRWIYDKPFYEKPEIGSKPAFLSDIPSVSLGTTPKFRRALDAIRDNKPYCKGALTEFFDMFVENLEKFRLKKDNGEIDESVIQNIEQFLPYRNEAIEIFLALAQYLNETDIHQRLHRFFEGLIPYLDKPEGVLSCYEWDFDNFRFIIHELFLYAVASLLKYECFDAVTYLMRQPYYCKSTFSNNNMVIFSEILQGMESLTHRKNRLKLNCPIRADLLKQRADATGFDFRQLMQADFVLYIRDCLDVLRYQSEKDFQRQRWIPDTLIVIGRFHGAFEIFARAASTEYFNRLKCLFDINEKKDFVPLFEAIREQRLFVPKRGWESINPVALSGYDYLATRP